MIKARNIMEIIVQRELEENKGLFKLTCDCEHCIADIYAITLNQFPAKYIVNDQLEPYVRVKYEVIQQGRAEILTEIIHAAKKVGEHPRCDSFKK